MSDIWMTSVDMAYGDDLNVVQEVTTERENFLYRYPAYRYYSAHGYTKVLR